MVTIIMKPVSRYRLYDDTELLQCIRDHAVQGWSPNLFPLANLGEPLPEGSAPDALAIRFSAPAGKSPQAGPCTDMIVLSDLTTIQFISKTDYVAAYPDNPLPPEEGGS